MSTPIGAPAKPLSNEQFMDKLDTLKPAVFPSVVAGKMEASTITATCFNLVNSDSQRLATLTTDQNECPGLAFFHPGSDRARLELTLESGGPAVRLNDVTGRQRLRVHLAADGAASVALMGPRGALRIVLAVDRDRPILSVCRRGARQRSVIVPVPFHKMAEPPAWRRVLRAAKGNKRAAFEAAALDVGFIAPELPKLWRFARRTLRRGAAKRKAAA